MFLVRWFQDSVFMSMGLRDVVDIGVITFIIYRALVVLRGTRAFQSLIGLLGLGALYLMARWLDLYSVRWVLDKFFVYLVLALLILFQQDIRSGLARAGGRFFTGFGQTAASGHEEVVRAVFALASRRIGALIVIERGASLDDLVQAGTRIDGTISQDLLVSIFHPTSPLHDGAVVIQKGRLAAAKVFLPLSVSHDIARYFGTRHRAALGLSDETDAAVIVVSEERGAVSLVMNGALTPVPDTNALRERLQQAVGTEEAA